MIEYKMDSAENNSRERKLVGKAEELLSQSKPTFDKYGREIDFEYERQIDECVITRGLPKNDATFRNHLEIRIRGSRVLNALYNDWRSELNAWSKDFGMDDSRDWRDWFMALPD